MSRQTKPARFNRPTLSACAVAMAAAVMAVVPTWTSAHEPAKTDTKSMPAEQMDHSKMDGMKGMDGTKEMDGMSMTGDTDYDFAANMRMHHQKAVDMSQAELKNGKNPQMRKMAKNIIAAQKKEIAEFDQWTEAHKPK